MDDLISRQAAIDALKYNQDVYSHNFHDDPIDKYTTAIIAVDIDSLVKLPSAQPEYEPAKIEDFAKTMSEKTLYRFMAWYGEALELMEECGFVICKKTM